MPTEKGEMDSRDALLVASVVPYGNSIDSHLEFIEEALGIPNVRLDLPGLTTNDGSHLDRRSAAIVSDHFCREFMARTEVRKRLGYEQDPFTTPKSEIRQSAPFLPGARQGCVRLIPKGDSG